MKVPASSAARRQPGARTAAPIVLVARAGGPRGPVGPGGSRHARRGGRLGSSRSGGLSGVPKWSCLQGKTEHRVTGGSRVYRRGLRRGARLEFGGVKVSLLDAPGYADFVGDLRAGLRAADAALFVVSASDGVDGATQLLWEECAAVGMPRAVVVTKLDSPRADFDEIVL